MSERKRFNTTTNNPNASMFVRNTGTTKKTLNETVCAASGSREMPNKKSSVASATKSEISEIELDLAYNGYLQALLKREIMEKKMQTQTRSLEGQILNQEEYIKKRKAILSKIQSDTELLNKKEEIVKMINTLEHNINFLKELYPNCHTEEQITSVQSALEDKSGTVVLVNTKPINTQEQHDLLMESLSKLTSALEKIVMSGRDFEGIHKLAENCKNLVQISKKVQETQVLLSTMESQAMYTVLQKLSDTFAKQYENMS